MSEPGAYLDRVLYPDLLGEQLVLAKPISEASLERHPVWPARIGPACKASKLQHLQALGTCSGDCDAGGCDAGGGGGGAGAGAGGGGRWWYLVVGAGIAAATAIVAADREHQE